MKGNFVRANNDCIYVHMIIFCRFDIEYAYVLERVLETYCIAKCICLDVLQSCYTNFILYKWELIMFA